jgi:hypothetical protein
MFFKNKQPSPTSAERRPILNFLILLAIIPVVPFYILFLLFRGRNKRFAIPALLFIIVLCCSGYLLYKSDMFGFKKIADSKIASAENYFSSNENYTEELKTTYSTLRKSIGAQKIPVQLHPMLDVEMDMLTINYYYYLISAGYMGENGDGAVYILQNALYSPNRILFEAAWKSLNFIDTAESKKVIADYNKNYQATLDAIEAKKAAAEAANKQNGSGNFSRDLKAKIGTEMNILKYKFGF